MMQTTDSTAGLSNEDRSLVETIAALTTPGPMSPSRRVAFEAALDARIARRTRSRRRAWMLAASGCAAGLAALAFVGVGRSPDRAATATRPLVTTASVQNVGGTQANLLVATFEGSTLGEQRSSWRQDQGYLPADYQAIAEAFRVP